MTNHETERQGLSTDKLIRDIVAYELGNETMPGPSRQARILLQVAELDRVHVSLLGNYFTNTTPGIRPSDGLDRAATLYRNQGLEAVKAYGRDKATGLRR